MNLRSISAFVSRNHFWFVTLYERCSTGWPSSPTPSSSGPGNVPGPFSSVSVTRRGSTT